MARFILRVSDTCAIITCLPNNELQQLTCTADSISSVARVAGAGKTSFSVSAACIAMTVVFINYTFIDVCIRMWLSVSIKRVHLQIGQGRILLTTAV